LLKCDADLLTCC